MPEQRAKVHHIPELDGVRGVAVLLVMLLHFHAPWLASRPLGLISDFCARGWTGVDLFFALSGFLITSILVSTRSASNYFSAFYARRALRIFPLAFAMIAFFYWVGVPLAHRHGQLPKLPEGEQLWYWLFLGNWRQGLGFNDGAELGHFWSLAIEEQFYLVFSLLARFVPGRRLAAVCVGLAVSSVVLRLLLYGFGYAHAADTELWRLTPLHLDPIALGALLACSSRFLHWSSRMGWLLLAAGVVALAFPLSAGLGIAAVSVAATGMVAIAATRPVRLLRNPVLTHCGKYSYAMYVLHPAWAVAILAKRYPHSLALMWSSLLLGPIVSYGLAVISWNVLEKHFLALKSRFPYRIPSAEGSDAAHLLEAASRRA